MEEKILLTFKTNIPFPLLKYKTNVIYNEVRKASGIAFILLDLIEKMPDAAERICDLLLKFGIPQDLHYIFGEEIANLIETEILSSDYDSLYFTEPKYFSEIKIKDVSLTTKGRKMFREGAIPTGMEKVKTKDVFYSPVTRRFSIDDPKLYPALKSSIIYEDIESFLEKTIDISGLKDFIEANKLKFGLKTEEWVIDVETPEGRQEMQDDKNEGTKVSMDKNGVVFSFKTSDEKAYFDEWYSSAVIEKYLLATEEYKFVYNRENVMHITTTPFSELNNAVGIYIPHDVTKQANRPCKIFIDRGRLSIERKDNVLKTDNDFSERLLEEIGPNVEFALLDASALHYYSALNVEIPCNQLNDTLKIQLLTENVLKEKRYKKLVDDIFWHYLQRQFNEDVAKVVLFTVVTLNDSLYFDIMIEKSFEDAKKVDEKIETLLKLHGAFSKNSKWQGHFVSKAQKLFEESVSEIKTDNTNSKSKVLDPLRKALGMNDFDYVSKFASKIVKTEDKDIVYEALLSAGFAANVILSVVNIVETFAAKAINNDNIFSDSDLGNKFRNIGRNLWKLNNMLGIISLSDYTLRDDYSEEEFFNAYATLKSAYMSVEKYEKYAPTSYVALRKYMEIFAPIHECLSIERNAASHPEKITEKYIDEQIARGKYKEAICDLFVKLQYDLRRILNARPMMSACDLLIKARDDGFINGKQESALHNLRRCRNGFQHPEAAQVQFDKSIIENWKDIVFEIRRN